VQHQLNIVEIKKSWQKAVGKKQNINNKVIIANCQL
jgi:hypothetical protein